MVLGKVPAATSTQRIGFYNDGAQWLDTVARRAQADRLIVTEYGVRSAWGAARIKKYVEDIESHPVVSGAFCYFGNDDGKYALYNGRDGNLTIAGRALSDVPVA